jgi:hypothetical protein
VANITSADVDKSLLDAIDTTLFANIYIGSRDINNRLLYANKTHSIKENINKYVEKLLTNSDFLNERIRNETLITFQFSIFNLELFTSDARKLGRLLLNSDYKQNSFIDYKQCEQLIRLENNIDDKTQIVVKKLEYSHKTFDDDVLIAPLSSDLSVSLSFYNSATKQQLDTKNCTANATIEYNLPIKNSSLVNLDKYRRVKDDTFDSFDVDSPGYHTRCYIKYDYQYHADTTINYRRRNYSQGVKAKCPQNCNYKGIDLDDYLKCSCEGTVDEVYYYFQEDYLSEITVPNLNIVECPHLTFTSVFIF